MLCFVQGSKTGPKDQSNEVITRKFSKTKSDTNLAMTR